MSAITVNQIRKNLSAFAKTWKDAHRENADAKLFWARFYECFGVRPESATIYEQSVKKLGGGQGFIDSFIPGKLIVEHKSKGGNLDRAFSQASDYFLALKEAERPRYIITSDFTNFRLYDLRTSIQSECKLSQLSSKADWFLFLVEDDAEGIIEESPINREAAYAVSKLHEALLRAKFKGRDLEVFLTRLLFCLFADDTGIFGSNGIFLRLIQRTREDGKDTGPMLAELFDVLNQPVSERQDNLDEDLAAFDYVNGGLFQERMGIPAFNGDLRKLLIKCAELDWSGISPAIFGAMFQGVLDAHAPDDKRQVTRRELGAHYTSERNILKVVDPLCMNDLRAELEACRRNKVKLKALYDKLPTLKFFDPACGCGNFLVIAYRELRRIENEVIAALFGFDRMRGLLDVSTLCQVRVNQFYGIEIDESAAHIARVAMWITDHQMNLEAADRFGTTRPTIPLIDSPTIKQGNALEVDWTSVLSPSECNYVLGNPPFIGKSNQTGPQKLDMERVFKGVKNAGLLDYVAAWYLKAAHYIQKTNIDVAFVSTNSITQGEQVAVLWPALLSMGVKIRFAHRTFRWSNEGKGKAAVHCVIVGFGIRTPTEHFLTDYGVDPGSEGTTTKVKRINPYLVDAADTLLPNRRKPIDPVSEMVYGSKPADGGHLLFSDEEKIEFLKHEPKASKYMKPFLGADEFLYSTKRWCLWLVDVLPTDLRAMPSVLKRVAQVKAMRQASTKEATQELASTPTHFAEIRQPTKGNYLIVPLHSSESRDYVPIGYCDSNVICGNANSMIPGATLYEFAIMNSTMHNAWMRNVCGRLESRYRYSNTIVYNNFIWPSDPSDTIKGQIEQAGQKILEARSRYGQASLADLYDPLAMPNELRKAHAALDKAVDAAYKYRGSNDDPSRGAFMFKLYEQRTSALASTATAKKPGRRTQKS